MARIASVVFVVARKEPQKLRKVIVRITNLHMVKGYKAAVPIEEVILLDVETPGKTREQRLYVDHVLVPNRHQERPNGLVSHYLTLESMTRLYVADLFDLKLEEVHASVLDIQATF